MISSDYSNYYSQLYSANSISKQNIITKDSNSSEGTVDTISSTKRSILPFEESGNIDDLELI